MNYPKFVVIGHPNEGKSSVVATLTENDNIRISPYPGETVRAHEYPVFLDDQCLLSFIDTPGFQNPKKTLALLEEYCQQPNGLAGFLEAYADDPGMKHECELLRPIADGARIIYVIDASRPLRRTDLMEMEILRLTGRPRIAILNCKTDEKDFLEEWQEALSKHVSIVRVFNALRATFAERIRLLESLRALDQEWESALSKIIKAFQDDWNNRNRACAVQVCDFLQEVLNLSVKAPRENKENHTLETELTGRLEDKLRKREKQLHNTISSYFRHVPHAFHLPEQSLLTQDLFSETTWTVFGLDKGQLVALAATAGTAAGAIIDLATLGHTLGIGMAIGGAAAGIAAYFRGENLTGQKFLGLSIGEKSYQIGPVNTVQWIYILLDRFFLHYWYVVHWAHARKKDDSLPEAERQKEKQGITSSWTKEERALCADFFRAVQKEENENLAKTEAEFLNLVTQKLEELSQD